MASIQEMLSPLGSATANAVLNAASRSPFLQDLLQQAAGNNSQIKISDKDDGTRSSQGTVIYDPEWLIGGKNNYSGDQIADILAHEFGHIVLPGGGGGVDNYTPTTDPVQQEQLGRDSEGVALVSEYIVAKQLGMAGPGSAGYSDSGITSTLNNIVSSKGLDINSLNVASAASLTAVGSDAQASAGSYYGNQSPSIAPNLNYDNYNYLSKIIQNCATTNIGSSVNLDQIDYMKAVNISQDISGNQLTFNGARTT